MWHFIFEDQQLISSLALLAKNHQCIRFGYEVLQGVPCMIDFAFGSMNYIIAGAV